MLNVLSILSVVIGLTILIAGEIFKRRLKVYTSSKIMERLKKRTTTFGIGVVLILMGGVLQLTNLHLSDDSITNSHKLQLSETMGTNIHELQWSANFSLMNDYGVSISRDALVWSIIEKKKGTYDFVHNGEINYDNFIENMENNHLRPYLMLLYTNDLYNNHMALDNERVKQGYANWAAASAKRYKNKNIIWEIYNEPNGEWFWTPQENSAQNYADVVKRTAPLIRKNDPSGLVVAPALAEVEDWSLKWLEDTLKEGILDYVDAIAVHPYRTSNPETVMEGYDKIRSLIAKYTTRNIPLISGEWGYSNVPNWNNQGASYIVADELQQAQYNTRMLLINQSQNIRASIVYDWKDDGQDATLVEHHFGLMNYDQTAPKQAGLAFKVLSDTLGQYQFVERINIGNGNDYLMKYTNHKKQTAYAFWTTSDDHIFTFKGKVNGEIIKMLGEKNSINEKNPSLELTKSPSYLIIR
ncbi:MULTISPECIES: cellulase family glycosylhydrolase [Priestia]|uniref:cellulase family glycosylhydrolase n=1 Tax=Priestia TaxID=2800373 RepID=UPI001C8D4230|nr:cellulase family glycosylhydrolase [Priestia aryabhattai]MBY0213510.1 cellulase family glycosylhydrolase [Priestia aryabhattai]MDT0148384.1 cellulase family glycosylhydrolase [Priestia aryabhattai]MDT0153750.1 cellulase family glycosylhydrolase [Priestia aryabhattai]